MTDDRNPPLFDALWALSGLTARHQLREDPAMSENWQPEQPRWEGHPDPTEYGLPPEHRYGSDDVSPPEVPLGQERVVDAAAPAERPELVACPRCGSGVDPDRIRR